jgi:hypothetical protein
MQSNSRNSNNVILDSDPFREETESMISDDEATYFRATETKQSQESKRKHVIRLP